MSRTVDEDLSPRNSKRPRVLVACHRCKARRQKCDNGTPACSNCTRGHVSCTYPENIYPSSYVKLLEDRVGALETQLRANDSRDPRDRSGNATEDENHPTDTPMPQEHRSQPARGQLASGLGLLSSCAVAEPHYFGFSSGLSLAHLIQTAIDAGSSSSTHAILPSLADRPFSDQSSNAPTSPAPLPTQAVGGRFIRAFLSTIYPLYPFLDKKRLWNIHKNASQQEKHTIINAKLDLIVLHLVYAIGARCLQLVNSSDVGKEMPDGHFMSAMTHISEAIRYTSIRAIEITLLLALHSMRSPSGTSVWHLCGLATRQCLELGLHKHRYVPGNQIEIDQARKRLFWSVYLFERKTALVVGRPFAVSDKEIDTDIPLSVNDGEGDTPSSARDICDHRPEHRVSSPVSNLTLHRHHVLLYHIHTRIRFILRRLKQNSAPGTLERKLATIFDELENWKKNVLLDYSKEISEKPTSLARMSSEDQETPSDSVFTQNFPFRRSIEIEKTELMLEYHKARRSLLQPLMTEMHHEYVFVLKDYLSCADSSGQICQLYRRLHRLSPVPFSLRDLHAVFVAGVTLVYTICLKPSLYDAKCAGDIGACSTVLYVIAEQWPSAKTYRDAFETVAERLVERTRKSMAPGTVNMQASDDSDEDGQAVTRSMRLSADQHIFRDADESVSSTHKSKSAVGSGEASRGLGVQHRDSFRTTETEKCGDERSLDANSQGYTITVENDVPPAISLDGDQFQCANQQEFCFDISTMLDLDLDDIGGLLTVEGMDCFTETVFSN